MVLAEQALACFYLTAEVCMLESGRRALGPLPYQLVRNSCGCQHVWALAGAGAELFPSGVRFAIDLAAVVVAAGHRSISA